MTGRRREDTREDLLPTDLRRGDYWKVLDAQTGEPKLVEHPGKLTKECWCAAVPIGDGEGFAIANLTNHTVREHDDGTISVQPGDGSSNSILVTGSRGRSWHGYIEHGWFYE